MQLRRDWKRILFAAILLAIPAYFLVHHMRDVMRTDTERLRLAAGDLLAQARERNVGGILAHVHPDYHSSRFPTDREELQRLLQRFWFIYKKVEIDPVPPDAIQVRFPDRQGESKDDPPDTAFVSFRAPVLLGTDPKAPATGDLVQRQRGTDRWDLVFRKTGGDWFVTALRPPGSGVDGGEGNDEQREQAAHDQQ